MIKERLGGVSIDRKLASIRNREQKVRRKIIKNHKLETQPIKINDNINEDKRRLFLRKGPKVAKLS